MINSVSIIGSGKLSFALTPVLKEKGLEIETIISRNIESGRKLSAQVRSDFHTIIVPQELRSDLVLIMVNDASIEEIADQLNGYKGIVAHTSGSVSIDVLKKLGLEKTGIFYPLQTFPLHRKIDFSEVPFCIEGSDKKVLDQLTEVAKRLSKRVEHLNSDQRAQLHLAAVFANNFSNHLFHIADTLLKEKDLSIDLLLPLLRESLINIKEGNPFENQTGPAVRQDLNTIKQQIEKLNAHPDYQKIYTLISDNIIKTHHH